MQKFKSLFVFLWKMLKNRLSVLKFCIIFKTAGSQDLPHLVVIIGDVLRAVPVRPHCDDLSPQFPVALQHIRMGMGEGKAVLQASCI